MKLALHWRILIGLSLGAMLGYCFYAFDGGASSGDPNIGFVHLGHITWFGDLFLKLLKMIVIPIIFCSLVVGVGHLPVNSVGKMGLMTVVVFKVQMLFAAFLGLFFVNLMQPGKYIDLKSILASGQGVEETHFITESKLSLSDLFMSMVPSNIFESLSNGSLIQVIIFSIIFGMALVRVKNGENVLDFFKICLNTVLKMTHWIMALAPFGVFALITKTVAFSGLESLIKYAPFVACVFAALASMIFIVCPLMVHFFTEFTPIQFFTGMRKVMLTAFSTSSSAATLPVTLEAMEEEFKIPNRVASFVIPLGATMSMNGAAIYESIVTLFVAQAWLPEPLTLQQQIFVVAMVLVATFGTPGIPHGSLVTIAVVFQAVGLPLEAIGVILSIDRILDMTRTMTNVTFDSLSCLIMNKYVGIKDEDPELALANNEYEGLKERVRAAKEEITQKRKTDREALTN